MPASKKLISFQISNQLQLAPEFRKSARLSQQDSDQVGFGTVDCEKHRHLCQLNSITTYPTIRLYANGEQYDYPSNWWRTAETIVQWTQQFKPTNVEALDEARLNELIDDPKVALLVDYYAPWCGHCVAFAPIYDQASRIMEGRGVHFAKVDCVQEPNACARAGVSAYPTIKLYSPGRRALNGGVRIHAQDAHRLIDVVTRVLGDYGHFRDEL